MTHIKTNMYLRCGCCGEDFKTWKGYSDQDQDDGYGICRKCQGGISEHDEAEWDKAIKVMEDSLNKDNLDVFHAMNREEQKDYVLEAIQDGVMEVVIKRR